MDEEPEAPPAPVISAEYDAEEDDPDSDDDARPQAPRPPIISKAEVFIYSFFHQQKYSPINRDMLLQKT